ncbi:MAG: sulfotransferase [Altererythrobacter sp.]|nr:sulfotransferase [Altererythrobacter sp.]
MDEALARAAQLSEAARRAGSADAHDHMTIALARAHAGAMDEADALIATALAQEPANPAILVGLALIRRQQGRLRDAVLACDEAIRIAPRYPDAWRERGGILAAGGSIAEARRSFAEAALLAPADSAAHAGLAALAAREGGAGEAEDHARRALAADPDNVVAACSLAAAMLATGRAGNVPAMLEPRLAALRHASPDRVLALSRLGDAWDRLGEHARAYDYYRRSKADFAALHAAEATGRMTHRQFVEAIASGLGELDPAAWQPTAGEQPDAAIAPHVFLIGYPRSGTTLAENVLASLPGVAALEERPTLAAADRAYLAGDAAAVAEGLAGFAALDEGGLMDLRAAYWANVRQSGVPAASSGFVDMDPLKGTRLPLISRLFPQTRILIMRRDPRDIVWSCFRTNFAMTSGTLEYTSLEAAAQHYDAMMRLTELALERLALATHIVPYHGLVQDFDATTRAMCDFAGLEWNEAVRGFDRTARRRGVSTASAAQVRRGLYDGTRQWQPYAEWLEPVMPVLEPWLEKFGYTA